jgi:hypothetical protein
MYSGDKMLVRWEDDKVLGVVELKAEAPFHFGRTFTQAYVL